LSNNKKKIAFFVNHANFFVSHRLPIALEAKRQGYQVHILVGQEATKDDVNYEKEIGGYGLKFHRVNFRASFSNIFAEVRGLLESYKYLSKLKPDIVHCISPKGCLYGGIISRLLKTKALVLSISGMGYIFTKNIDSNKFNFMQSVYSRFLKFILKHKNLTVIVQNKDDETFFHEYFSVKKSDISKIQGSGINLKLYENVSFSNKKKIVMMASRPLHKKGVVEFIESSIILKKRHKDWRFILAGGLDYESPDRISSSRINEWNKEGSVEFLGHVKDISDLYLKSSIVCLPSYREGFPKTLIEASASGNAIVTTNTTGCREAVEEGKSGFLVNVGSVEEIVICIEKLINSKALREEFGNYGMKEARLKHSIDLIVEKNIKIYDNLITK
tara:strand:+ start:40432 stop:41592 length:1161 start_codon:yes stop_codon:yes gene_type:complete